MSSNDSKRIEIVSPGGTLGPALRILLLSEYEVEILPLQEVGSPDVLIWQFEDRVNALELMRVSKKTSTLVLADSDELMRAVDAGCRGFLPKTSSLDSIVAAVDTIAEGQAFIPPNLLGTVLKRVVERQRRELPASDGLAELTEREREVFRIAASGANRHRIASMLFISPETVRTHLQRVYQKLGVHSQAELMSLAVRIGEFEPEDWV